MTDKKQLNFRKFRTSSGKAVLVGKSAEQNEILVKKYLGKENVILHTAKPGSPFAVIRGRNSGKEDIKEAAVFCARYSQDWRDNKKDVVVHIFSGKDAYKDEQMKLGTFGVKRHKKIIVKKEEIKKLGK